MSDDSRCRRYVLGDWGTSRLRLFLLENDVIAGSCEGPGIGMLGRSSATTALDTLADLLAPWIAGCPPAFPVVLSGMAGARNGLVEVPYAMPPLHGEAWASQAATLQTASMRLTIAAGVRSGIDTRPDVMRGEETQIFGAMELSPVLARASHVVLLPGTHSKWADVSEGSIVRFRSAMTGELFALLRDHSTLLRTGPAQAGEPVDGEADRTEGFQAGLSRSANPEGGLLAAIFEARAAQLIDSRSPCWASGFLSGLLIGREVGAMAEIFHTDASITVIGDAQLTALYQAVFTSRGVQAHVLDGSNCSIAGLQYLLKHHPEI